MPFQSHQIHSITFFGCRLDNFIFLWVPSLYCCKQSIFHHLWLFFSKMDHFCYVWAENSRWLYGSVHFFSLNHEAPKHVLMVHISKCFQIAYNTCMKYVEYLPMMSYVMWPRLFFIWSSSMTADLLKCSQSSRSKSPLLNLANHLQAVLSAMAPYLHKWHISSFCCL